jgi:hypothetical protein
LSSESSNSSRQARITSGFAGSKKKKKGGGEVYFHLLSVVHAYLQTTPFAYSDNSLTKCIMLY